jgi:outer membrane lipoprotein-sorting protein
MRESIGHEETAKRMIILLLEALALSCPAYGLFANRPANDLRVFPMRRISCLAVAVLAATFLTGAGQPAPQRLYQAFSEQQKADLDRISAYLNSVRTLKSGFVQIGPEGGVDQGQLYIAKPGHIRFEYNPPSPILIVATGGAVYVKNSKLNTVDKYDLSDTPLGLLLNDRVDLKTNKAVLGVNEQDGVIIVSARTATNRNSANITMVFSAPNI